MSHLLAFALSLTGFAALAAAMNRQQRDLFGKVLRPGLTRLLLIAGALALLGALIVLVGRFDWGLGLVMFSGHTSLAAGIVVVGLIARVGTHGRSPRHR